MATSRLFAMIGCLVFAITFEDAAFAQQPDYTPPVFAIENVKAYTTPGEMLESATIVIRNGAIVAVGPSDEVTVPFDAERISGEGLVAYCGFIDAFNTTGIEESAQRSRTGAGAAIDYGSFAWGSTPADNRNGLTAEFLVAEALDLKDADADKLRSAGFTSSLIAPNGGIVTGHSALVSLTGDPRREVIIESPVALHVSLESPGSRNGYPTTLMGYVAHLRQANLDARHNENAWEFYREHGGERPPVDPTLTALRRAQTGQVRVFWEANSEDEIHRALDLSDEFGYSPVIVGGREAWKVSDRLAAEDVSVIVRIDFGDEPKTGNTGRGRGRRGGFSEMTPDRLKEMLARPDMPDQFRARIQERLDEIEKEASSATKPKPKTPERKLPESPRLLAEAKRQWNERIEGVGKLADAGVSFCFTTDGHSNTSDFAGNVRKAINGGLKAEAAVAALTTNPAEILRVENRAGRMAPGRAAHLALYTKPFEDEESKLRFVFVDRKKYEYNKPGDEQEADDEKKGEEKKDDETPDEEKKDEESTDESKPADEAKPDDEAKPSDDEGPSRRRGPRAEAEPFPTEIESDREPSFHTGGNVVIRNATVLTVTNGTLFDTTIVVQDGKITAMGTDIDTPDGIHVIEADGLYVMPGIIDTHSHIAVSGGVNESSLAVVPEVRIKDVVDGDSVSIYRALSGGLTTARLLHGSANPIGGQDAVIKLRYGKPARELIVHERPRGVKFALGENPKRSTSRYPDTRLGVEAVIRRAFEEAKMYRRIWQLYAAAKGRGELVAEPRRDLRLEALADILDSELLIHSHCYRADEILMLMRLVESYGVRVKSLQHVLEGYKVAAEIAAHGASNSTFSDWWAYKIEAYDAIPHNAALLIKAGAEVVLKSDDSELMRHLYQEAAKTMRYGGLSEENALRTITINAASQIGLADRIGSIEVGKDADLAIFNGHPLNGFARCELTLIDGEVYFERKGEHVGSGHGLSVAEDRRGNLDIPESSNGRYALVNAHIVPVAGNEIEQGTVLIDGGIIQAVTKGENVPDGFARVDLDGLSVYPGMINVGGSVGLTEIGSIKETQDYSERGDYNSDLRASIALHPDSEIIPVTRANGVLTTLTHPTGGVISGQSVLINLAGWIPPEMAIVDAATLHINFPTGSYGEGNRAKSARHKIDDLKERMKLAIRFDEIRQKADERGSTPATPDTKLQALAPYARGEKLIVLHASGHGDILSAIEFAKEMKLKWVLADATEAWKCAAELKKNDVQVLLGPSMATPRGTGAPYDIAYRNAAVLHEAGVRFAMTAADSATKVRNLPFEAAMAVSYGLPTDEGLKAVTLYPAQLLGVDDLLGSIEEGKMANLVISDGNLLQPATQVKALFIAGRPMAPTSRHTRLFDRYSERLEEVQQGTSPLGVGK